MSIYKNITREEYNELDGVRASMLKSYYESALNGNFENSKPRTETAAMRFGTATHSKILEPDKFLTDYSVLELPINEKTGKEYGSDTKKAKEYIALLPNDKLYLSEADNETLNQIETNIKNHKNAMTILNACTEREFAITWVDEESGTKCKSLIDFASENMAGDLKTCREIKYRSSKEDIAKALFWDIVGNRNLLQFSFYMDGLLANDLDIQKFAVIFAQNCGNCEVLAAFLSDYALDFGRAMYSQALLNYALKDDNKSAFTSMVEI